MVHGFRVSQKLGTGFFRYVRFGQARPVIGCAISPCWRPARARASAFEDGAEGVFGVHRHGR